MFIHDTYSLLAEAAAMDLSANTEGVLTESEIDTRMKNIDEVSEDIIYTAEMVTVIAVDESYLTDINALMPFMKTNGIKSVGEALDMVAEANGMPPKSIGLLVESDAYVDALLEKACAKKTKEGKNKILDKIKKATDLSDKLKKKGYTNDGVIKELTGQEPKIKGFYYRENLKKSDEDKYFEYVDYIHEVLNVDEDYYPDINEVQKHIAVCIDCGRVFHVDTKNNAAKRCPECQAEYRRKYKAEKEKERRKKKKYNG